MTAVSWQLEHWPPATSVDLGGWDWASFLPDHVSRCFFQTMSPFGEETALILLTLALKPLGVYLA